MDHERPDSSGDIARKLDNIRAITDEAFLYMGVDEFLDSFLDRVSQIMDVDTAVVLLVDPKAQVLVPVIAKGIEEEVVQGTRVPVGKGFAGRVAADRLPVVIDDTAKVEIINPLLLQHGLRSLLGVPLIAGGELIGVLHVGTVTHRRFTTEDVEFLQLAAGRVALGVHSLKSRAERAATRQLQRSLVPSALPEIPGAELASRYKAGTSIVGGDWYDVFTLPTQEVGVVMGDVTGSGLPAAVVMGRMRSALRAYALEFSDPAEVLHRLDRKMAHFEPDAMATVLYAVFDPSLERVRISSAGHWPPVLAIPGKEAALVDLEPDLLIGSGEDHPRHTATVDVPPGSALCFYTDGLIERRDAPIDSGLAKLCDAVQPAPPELVCVTVMGRLLGRTAAGDDVALLVIRRREN